MARKKTARDAFEAPAGADLTYIAEDLRSLAVLIDSLGLDTANIKDHGDEDLPQHAASLRQFGIRRAIVVRRSDRQILAGNGCVMASIRNGWAYVPAIFVDDDFAKSRAFAAADNLVATLAPINRDNLEALVAEIDGLFTESELKDMTAGIWDELQKIDVESTIAPSDEQSSDGNVAQEPQVAADKNIGDKNTGTMTANDVVLIHRVIAVCRDEDDQVKLLAELENRGYSCRLSTIQDK